MTSHIDSQNAFSHNLRKHKPIKVISGIEPKHMDLYQSLVYNNIESILRKIFPILISILSKKQWNHYVQDFISNHQCNSPYFRDISHSFVTYISSLDKSKLPLLLIPELAHYEWIELDVELQISKEPSSYDVNTYNAEKHKLFVLPSVRIVTYQFPVHQICKDFTPHTPSNKPYFFCVYRTKNYQVKFMQLNALSANLLSIFLTEELTSIKAIKCLAELSSTPFTNKLVINGNKLCYSFIDKNILGIKISE